MKIFISWSGSISKKLAEAFRQWIPGVIQAARPYYSPDDISKGSRWNTEISKELDNSRIGIICLTKDNLQAPWIMFEAGALSKNIEISKVCPILFGIEPSDIEGPLVQFQAAKFSKDEMKKVTRMINLELGENSLSSDVLDSVFEMWWPKLKDTVEEILKDSVPANNNNIRSEREILEEILGLTRSAYITKEREPNGVRAISPSAFTDLCRNYLSVVKEVQKIANATSLENLVEAVHNLRRPLKHITNRLNYSSEQKDKITNLINEADSIIGATYRSVSIMYLSESEIDFGKENSNSGEASE